MPTIKDIAKKAGVSVATVSYVMNNSRNVSRRTKERVLKAIEELNYIPNAVARGLRFQKTQTLGLVMSDITNPFYPDLAKGCEDVASELDYSVMILNTDGQQNRFKNAYLHLLDGKVDGLIIASALNDDQPLIKELIEMGHPIVLAHRKLPNVEVDSVVADNYGGAKDAIRYLISLGHKKIAMVTGVEKSSVSRERMKGYLDAMKEESLEILPEWLELGDKYHHGYSAARKFMSLVDNKRPTAIFTVNDVSAIGVLDAASDIGFKVPEDVAVIGFEDLLLSKIRSIQLTTVRIPRYELGQVALRLLVDRISNKNKLPVTQKILPTQLIIRNTCGSLRKRGNTFKL